MTSFPAMLRCCFDRCLFLAGEAHYAQMGRRFQRRGGGFDWTELLLPIIVIACAVGFAWLLSRCFQLRAERKADSPAGLFAELCRAHGLGWSSRQLLHALARAHRLSSPAQLFVEPERFDAKQLGESFDSRRGQIAALQARLFADPTSEEPEAD